MNASFHLQVVGFADGVIEALDKLWKHIPYVEDHARGDVFYIYTNIGDADCFDLTMLAEIRDRLYRFALVHNLVLRVEGKIVLYDGDFDAIYPCDFLVYRNTAIEMWGIEGAFHILLDALSQAHELIDQQDIQLRRITNEKFGLQNRLNNHHQIFNTLKGELMRYNGGRNIDLGWMEKGLGLRD